VTDQLPERDGLIKTVSKQSATQLDSLKVRRSPELLETSEESGPRVTGQKQTEKLDWFST